MSLFDVGRGHDGPARVGALKIGGVTVETPLLAGHQDTSADVLTYGVLGRSQPQRGSSSASAHSIAADSLSIMAIPNLTGDHGGLELVGNRMMLILPSMISLEHISERAGGLLLEYQFDFLQKHTSIDPSQTILRVPVGTDLPSMETWIPRFADAGVRAASFTFDGRLGPSDFSSLSLRSALPTSWVAAAMGRMHPSIVPLLYYMGFDVFDTGHAVEAAEKGVRLWPMDSECLRPSNHHTGPKKPYRYCPCAACAQLPLDAQGVEGTMSLASLSEQHNLHIYRQVLSESLDAMLSGRLRWLVESYTHGSPALASLLRRVDRDLYTYTEEFTPTTGSTTLDLIGPESYNAPVVRRFRDYVASRYAPPPGKRIVVLLPCSARKPYSDSKSHRRYLSAIESTLGRNPHTVSQVILTSPLGLVPRELERIYPASVYDIPVTGDWDYEEIQIGAEALKKHLAKFDASTVVVAHVSGGYVRIVNAAEPEIRQSVIYTTPEDSPSRRDSLKALEETLKDLKESLDLKQTPGAYLQEIVMATADYQFGAGAGDLLLPLEADFRGKPYGTILCKLAGNQLCSFIGNSGTVSLTLEGARRLQHLKRYWVRLEAPRAKGGSIFAVGVNHADPDIRPGDEVIVVNESDEVVAVGKSEMSGREMCELSRGRAVSVRHKLED